MTFRDLRIVPCRDCTASIVLDVLKRIENGEGLMEELWTDNGTHFTAGIIAEWCKTRGIRHVRSPPRHPESNGMAERVIRIDCENMTMSPLKTLADSLQNIQNKYNATCHTSTGYCPFEVARGRSRGVHVSWLPGLTRMRPKQQNVSWKLEA